MNYLHVAGKLLREPKWINLVELEKSAEMP